MQFTPTNKAQLAQEVTLLVKSLGDPLRNCLRDAMSCLRQEQQHQPVAQSITTK